MAPWVNGTSQQKKDEKIDQLYAALNAEMDEGKRKQIFADFQKHMYDNAVATKAGNYGLFQVASAKLKNFKPSRIPRMWGVWLEQSEAGRAGGTASARLRKEGRWRGFLTKRLAGAFVVLVLVSLMSFAIIWLVPGDPTAAFLDTSSTPEQVERLRRELGLDQPVIVQMLDWYGRILHGDLGHSILLNRSVTAAILERLPVTLSLAGIALVLALMVGVLAGIVAAVNHNRWPDQVVMTAALIGLSVPDFWLGIMLILLLAVKFGLFPTGGYVPLSENPLGWLAASSCRP